MKEGEIDSADVGGYICRLSILTSVKGINLHMIWTATASIICIDFAMCNLVKTGFQTDFINPQSWMAVYQKNYLTAAESPSSLPKQGRES